MKPWHITLFVVLLAVGALLGWYFAAYLKRRNDR